VLGCPGQRKCPDGYLYCEGHSCNAIGCPQRRGMCHVHRPPNHFQSSVSADLGSVESSKSSINARTDTTDPPNIWREHEQPIATPSGEIQISLSSRYRCTAKCSKPRAHSVGSWFCVGHECPHQGCYDRKGSCRKHNTAIELVSLQDHSRIPIILPSRLPSSRPAFMDEEDYKDWHPCQMPDCLKGAVNGRELCDVHSTDSTQSAEVGVAFIDNPARRPV
jgi:hypothetical protein